MIKNKSKNLFDKGSVITGFFIAVDGSIQSDTFNFYHPDFIPIQAGQTITTSNATATIHRIVFYNSSQVFISREVVSSATSLTATAPSNAKFFRVSALISQLNTFQSELGSTATAYVPYNDIQISVGQFEQGQGKNLFDGRFLADTFMSGINGSLSSITGARTTLPIAVLPSRTYTATTDDRANYRFLDSNQSLISFFDGGVSSQITFTTTSNTAFVQIYYSRFGTNTQIQLELGNTATPYEPYKYLAIHNPASNDIPIPALNNKTLNEVFNTTNNLFFSNLGTFAFSNIVRTNGTIGYNYSLTVTSDGQFTQNITTGSDVLYVGYEFISSSLTPVLSRWNSFSDTTGISTTPPRFNSWLGTKTAPSFGARFTVTGLTFNIVINNLFVFNLTSLGIASQTQAQMDAYFQAWQRNNAGTLLANTFIQHDQNSVPIADLNGKTLDEVFIGGQLVNNGDFENGFTTWEVAGSTITINDGIVNFNVNNTLAYLNKDFTAFNFTTYAITRVKKNSGTNFRIDLSTSNKLLITETEFNNANNEYNLYSKIFTSSDNINRVFIGRGNAQTHNTDVDYVKIYNLTALGITATKEQLDFWYSVWQQNHKLGMRVHRASGNDIPLAVLNNQSLNQVFVGGQLLLNNEFSNGTTNWDLRSNTSQNVVDGVNTITATATGTTIGIQQSGFTTNLSYVNIRFNPQSSNNLHVADGGGNFIFSVTPNIWQNKSGIRASTDTTFRIYQSMTSGQSLQVDSVVAINLTSLGIATLTKSQLDYLYQVWQFNQVNALVARQFIQEA